MKKFYELRMKNGRSFMTSTDHKGICQFTINDREFSIFSEENGGKDFTFSVEIDLEPEESFSFLPDQDLEVVALQEVAVKKGERAKFIPIDGESLWNEGPTEKRAFIIWKGNFYFAKHGGIQTPAGWIYA